MRKTLIALLFLPMLAFVSADWVTTKLDDRASIDFPAQIESQDLGGNPMWLHQINNEARCMVMIMDFSKMGMDSATLADEMAKPESFAQFREGVVGEIAGSSVLSEKNTSFNGHKAFEFLIDMGKDSSKLNRMYNKNIFIGTKMYSISFFEKEGKPQAELRNKFFNSFKAK